MSAVPQGPLVCGFGDLASGVAGLAWDLAEPAAARLEGGKATAGSFALEEGGDAATVAISAGETVTEAVLAPGIDPVRLEPPNGAGKPFTVTPCTAEVHSPGGAETLAGLGQISRWSEDPLEGAGTFRHLTVQAPEGALLVATALGEAGIEGHGEERTTAWRVEADGGELRFGEALISTQYDGEGRPTRVGLELWPGEDSPPTRVACSLLAATDAGGSWVGFMRCHVDGHEELGSYLLRRR